MFLLTAAASSTHTDPIRLLQAWSKPLVHASALLKKKTTSFHARSLTTSSCFSIMTFTQRISEEFNAFFSSLHYVTFLPTSHPLTIVILVRQEKNANNTEILLLQSSTAKKTTQIKIKILNLLNSFHDWRRHHHSASLHICLIWISYLRVVCSNTLRREGESGALATNAARDLERMRTKRQEFCFSFFCWLSSSAPLSPQRLTLSAERYFRDKNGNCNILLLHHNRCSVIPASS